eukprot:INCI9926.3.p1 GENE.INCI9926.3~~INCI9926.3.p1  ORF type:complete len:1575 (+),score=249.58 INCI9926.3:64-4788(+)
MQMWKLEFAEIEKKEAPRHEALERSDSARLVPGFKDSNKKSRKGGKMKPAHDLQRSDTRALLEEGEAARQRRRKKEKSSSRKQKEGLIVVKQFVLYGLFALCLVRCYLYQAAFETPSFCLPTVYESAPAPCYEPLYGTLDHETLFANAAGGFNFDNVHGYPEYAVNMSGNTLYHMRGNFPAINRLVHVFIPFVVGILAIYYGLWRFLRHHQCVKLESRTKVFGAIVGFVVFLSLAVVTIVSLSQLDAPVRSNWFHTLQLLDSHVQATFEDFNLGAWNATSPNVEVVSPVGSVVAYSSANSSAVPDTAVVLRSTVDFSRQADVVEYCQIVCLADSSCVGFYLREFSLELSACDDVFFCDFYSALNVTGEYVEVHPLGITADASSGDYSLYTEKELIAAEQQLYEQDPSNSKASTELGNPTGSMEAAENYCELLDSNSTVDPNITNHGINATNVRLFRLLDRSPYQAVVESKSLFFDFVFNQTAAGTVARVWHEFLMAKCKNGVVEAAAWLALQGSTSQLDLSSFMSYDANADTSATAIKPGLNLTSAECFGMEIGSWLDLVTTKAGSFYAVDVETGLEQGSLLLAMAIPVFEMLDVIIVLLLVIITVLSGVTVANRLITLISRVERCTNCEVAYSLKQQPLHCASCDDVFCRECLLYSVKGQKFGLFASEVRSGGGTADAKKDKLVCMDCFSQSFDKSVEMLLRYSLGQNDLATGFMNFLLSTFVLELEERGFDDAAGAPRNTPKDMRIHDALHMMHSELPTDISTGGGRVKVILPDKALIVRKLKSELRRTFGDMLDFRKDFMEETLAIIDTLYSFAEALNARGSTVTLEDFHKQTRKFPRSSFIEVFLDKYNMDIERALATLENSRKVKHLGHLRALFEEIIEFTRSAEEPDPHQKPMLLANSYTYDEVLKAQFRCEKDPLYRTETAVAVPNQTVLSFAKKFYELPPHQQELFHEQLLWHSKAAQRSFEERRATTTALYNVFVVMVRPFGSTAAPNVYHMYILEDFLAFFRAPAGLDDPCLVIDPSIINKGPTRTSLKEHVRAKTTLLVEEFCELHETKLSHGERAARGQHENKGSSEGGGGVKNTKHSTRRVSLHDLEFILTRSDVPYMSKTSRAGGEFGGSGGANAEVAPEGAQRVLHHYYTRGKTQIVLNGIYSHVLEVVIARAPNDELIDRLPKLASTLTNRLFSKLLSWQSSLPTANVLGILRYESSFPPREEGGCKMYLNGLDYFRDVVEAIGAARYNIMIADWCMSPRIYLRRESGPLQTFRLDLLLQRKARQGVQVFVLLYKDIAIGLGSDRTEDFLVKLHTNIHVVRHNCLKSTISDTAKFDKIYYSHHQKCVVVDNSAAFVGGIDLCYGRFETPDYTLKDLDGKWYPGHSFKNPQLELEGGNPKSHIDEPFLTPVQMDRHHHWRMPWNDVHSCVTGKAAADVALMLTQRWQTHNQTNGVHPKIPVWPGPLLRDWGLDGLWPAGSVQLLRSMARWSGNEVNETSIYRCYLEMIRKAKHSIYIENQFFISAIEGNNAVHNRICQALFDRIMIAIQQKQDFRVIIVVPFHADGPLHSEMVRCLYSI